MITWSSSLFGNPSTFLIEVVVSIHDYVIMLLFSVLLFVLLNLCYTAKFSHFNLEFYENHQLEGLWTASPFFILLCIAIPSLMSLYMLDSCMFCGITLSVIGHQWYWRYFYKDFREMFFDSYMLPSDRAFIRLTDVDNRVIVPSNTPIRFLVSSSDVIHSWTLPTFGVKIDAIPGRINQFCFLSARSGVFFGQCSEICGTNHSFMPIVMERVPFNDFFFSISWLNSLFKASSF